MTPPPQAMTDHCHEWTDIWLYIFAHAAKRVGDAPGGFDWAPLLPQLFTSVLGALGLPVDGSLSDSRGLPREALVLGMPAWGDTMKQAGKLIVRLLGCGGAGGDDADSAIGRLELLLRVASTFMHPSNNGHATTSVATLLNRLAYAFAKRLGAERAAAAAGGGDASGHLTVAVRRRFVAAVLPLVELGLYNPSRGIVMPCQLALKHLAGVAPALIAPRVADMALRCLDAGALTAVHHAPNAFRALAATLRPLTWPVPLLAHVLPRLLDLTLAGIDPNDGTKAMEALSFVHAVLSAVPLVNATETEPAPSEAAAAASGGRALPPSLRTGARDEGTAPRDDDADGVLTPEGAAGAFSAAWGATEALVEWAPALLGRLLALHEAAGAPSKTSMADMLGGRVRRLAAFVFFQQMSPALLRDCVGRLSDWLAGLSPLPAVKDVAHLIACATAADASVAIARLLPPLVERAGGALALLAAHGGGDGAGGAAASWHLRLLSGVVRGGGATLLPHLGALRRVVAAGFAAGAAGVRKEAGRVLRHTLVALSGVYACEHRSHAPAVWRRPGLWAAWGAPHEWSPAALDVAWHVPSAGESAAVKRCARACMHACMCACRRIRVRASG